MTAKLLTGEKLREVLWQIKYGDPITQKEKRGLDHYPFAYKSFLEFEKKCTDLINSQKQAAESLLLAKITLQYADSLLTHESLGAYLKELYESIDKAENTLE